MRCGDADASDAMGAMALSAGADAPYNSRSDVAMALPAFNISNVNIPINKCCARAETSAQLPEADGCCWSGCGRDDRSIFHAGFAASLAVTNIQPRTNLRVKSNGANQRKEAETPPFEWITKMRERPVLNAGKAPNAERCLERVKTHRSNHLLLKGSSLFSHLLVGRITVGDLLSASALALQHFRLHLHLLLSPPPLKWMADSGSEMDGSSWLLHRNRLSLFAFQSSFFRFVQN